MKGMGNEKKLGMVLGIIFLAMFLLNHFYYRGMGDDYVYSFMWEGHALYEPLSENARRIGSFSDIAVSTWSYFLTWGGRMVAQGLAMFFLWLPKWVFDLSVSGTTVLLVLLVQWIACEGRITMALSPVTVGLTAFSFWAFHANFVGVFTWVDGSCNYLWPIVFLLLFLLPYIRHYFTDGAVTYRSWMTPLMFFVGLLAGNGNENTLCWIGLFGFFYLISCWRKKKLTAWMMAGFVGLSIGYGLLMLAPGNFLRMEARDQAISFSHVNAAGLVAIWFSTLLQSGLWFYILKGFKKRKALAKSRYGKKYFSLAIWMVVMAWCFNLIMLVSPEFPNRSLFPGMTFCVIAAFLIRRAAEMSGASILSPSMARVLTPFAVLYFLFTFSVSLWWYIGTWQWHQRVLAQVEAHQGSDEILVITEPPPNQEILWSYLSGIHLYNAGISAKENSWPNVAFARFYHIKGIKMETAEGE